MFFFCEENDISGDSPIFFCLANDFPKTLQRIKMIWPDFDCMKNYFRIFF